jgi:RNA polymerase sigma-70 factor (ECF subfamily)
MDPSHPSGGQLAELQRVIEQLNRGDASVRGELLNLANQQLMRLTQDLRQQLDSLDDSVRPELPWEELFLGASARLYETLHDTVIKDARHFFQIASLQIRRELIELCRQSGQPANRELAELGQMHDDVDALSRHTREVFELIWYHEMTHPQVAELLNCSVAEVRRLWRSARLELHGRFEERASDENGTKFAGD